MKISATWSSVVIYCVAKHAGDGSLHGAPESLGHRVLLLCVWGGEALGDAILIAPVGEVAFRVHGGGVGIDDADGASAVRDVIDVLREPCEIRRPTRLR